MSFSVKTTVNQCSDFTEFLSQYNVGTSDLIITNEYVLTPQLGGKPLPCDVLYQENYGTGEPSDEMVDSMLAAADSKDYQRIIAVGGGTVIDISKLFVFGSGLRCDEIFAGGATLPRKRSLIIVPTTCGTGSEVTNISIIEFKKKQTKIGLAVPALFADEAVLIGSMLSTLPYGVFATSSIDALIHAVESYMSPKANAFTRALGREAIHTIIAGYQKLVASGKKDALPDEMQDFLVASTMAGIAFGNAGCAAVHALAYPIGGIYHVPHGKATYLMFEQVYVSYREHGADLTDLEKVFGEVLGCAENKVWTNLFALIDQILPRQPIRELGVGEKECLEMAESVIINQQRLLANNPVELSKEAIAEIYRRCM